MDLRLWIYFIIWILYPAGILNQRFTGCRKMINSNDCLNSIECTGRLNLNQVSFSPSQSYPKCHNSIYVNYDYYLPVYLTYRRTNFDDVNEMYWESNVVLNLVVTMDFSNNQFKIEPPLSNMPDLKVLNMSNNLLTVAKLSNLNSYNNLVNVDFSSNAINNIKVFNHQHIYKQMQILDLSHNVLDNIPETVFDSFSNLQHLNLSYNRFTVLNILSFIGLINLNSLLLDSNQITDINSSLLRLRYLHELSLNHNRLERVSKHDFQTLISLKKLDLSFNKIMDIEKNAFDNMTFLSELDLSENALDVINEDTFKNTFNLIKIDLSVNKLKHLPKELFKGRTISNFSIENNILEGKLVNGMFLGLNNTIRLNIANQYLTSIEDYAFTGLEKLELLLLNNNKINNLTKNSFKSLQNIKHLDLSDNFIVNIDFEKNDLINLQSFSIKNNFVNEIHGGTFKYLNRLQSLDLSFNNISNVENEAFENLNELTTFEIRNNPIGNILSSKIFIGLIQLPDLDISQHEISLVRNNTFESMEQLKYLNLSHNVIADLQFNAFVSTGNITTIDLSHNKLSHFLINTTDLQNLSSLLMNNNLLTKISTGTLRGLSSLLKVIFSYNNLSIINDKSFTDQKSLLFLDLSFNPLLNFKISTFPLLEKLQNLKISGTITDISSTNFNNTQLTELEVCYAHINTLTNTSFNYFEHLENLVVNNNEITTITNNTFYKVVYLQHLDLSNNLLTFIQSGAFKNNHNLKTLNISHNSLVVFNYGALHGLISLDILDISFNNIVNLQKEVLIEAENLKILIADNNQIGDIDDVEINDIHLSELSIGGNPISCKRVYELHQRVRFRLTSLTKIEHNDNINGIKCHKDIPMYKEKYPANDNNVTDKVLNILRNILINSPSGRSDEHPNDDEHLSKFTDLIQKSNSEVVQQLQLLNDASTSIKSDNNQTHALLERLLRVLVTMNSALKPSVPPPRENATLNDLTSYVNKIRQELENDIIIQKEGVLAEVDSKISLAIARGKYYKENLVENKEPLQNDYRFIEICLGLLLSMSCAFIMYKTYKFCKNGSRSRLVSLSRRHVTESLENSTL